VQATDGRNSMFDYLVKMADLTPVAEEFCKQFKPDQLAELDRKIRAEFAFKGLGSLIRRVKAIDLEKAEFLKEIEVRWENDIWDFYRDGIDQHLQSLGFSEFTHGYWLLKTSYGYGGITFDNVGHPGYLKLGLARLPRAKNYSLPKLIEEFSESEYLRGWTKSLASYFDQQVASYLLPIWDCWNERELRLKEINRSTRIAGLPILLMGEEHFPDFHAACKRLGDEQTPVREILHDARFKGEWKTEI